MIFAYYYNDIHVCCMNPYKIKASECPYIGTVVRQLSKRQLASFTLKFIVLMTSSLLRILSVSMQQISYYIRFSCQ